MVMTARWNSPGELEVFGVVSITTLMKQKKKDTPSVHQVQTDSVARVKRQAAISHCLDWHGSCLRPSTLVDAFLTGFTQAGQR